jgi:hypothetical protein
MVAGADAVIAVRDLQGYACVDVAADEQDRRESFILRDLREVGFDVRVVLRQQPQAGDPQDVLGFFVRDRRGFELGDEFLDSGLVGDEGEVVAGGGVVVVVGFGFPADGLEGPVVGDFGETAAWSRRLRVAGHSRSNDPAGAAVNGAVRSVDRHILIIAGCGENELLDNVVWGFP